MDAGNYHSGFRKDSLERSENGRGGAATSANNRAQLLRHSSKRFWFCPSLLPVIVTPTSESNRLCIFVAIAA
jgi:hypothetical protein